MTYILITEYDTSDYPAGRRYDIEWGFRSEAEADMAIAEREAEIAELSDNPEENTQFYIALLVGGDEHNARNEHSF